MIEGYKETAIGLLPIQWKVYELGEIGEFKNGINKGKEDFGHGFPMVNLNDVFGVSTVKNQNLGLVNSTINERKDYFLAKGDVLFIRSSVKPSGVGLTAVIPYDLVNTVYSGFIIRFRDNDILDINFKKHCFYEIGFRNRLLAKSSVSANTNINQKSLSSLPIGVPPLPEQLKIAEILSTVDDKIEVIDQQIIETQALKKGLMQRLLTKGIGHTEFKDSSLGMIPKSWEVEKLGKVAASFAGGTPKRGVEGYYGGKIPWIKSGEVNNNSIEEAEEHVTELALKESSAKLIKENSILVAMYGATAGKVGILKVSACSNQAVLAINSKVSELTNLFLYHYLKKSTIELLNLCQGSGQPNLSKGIVDSLQIPIPPIPEQQKISQILNSFDDKLEVLSEKKTHFQELKQGLMQQLLTGKIRVKV